VGVQEVRWNKSSTEWAKNYTFFYTEKNEDHQLATGFFMHKRKISVIRRVDFSSFRMSYIILRGVWCIIIVLNVYVQCENKRDDTMESSYEELGHVFDFLRMM
jgi:fucose permease